MSNETTYAGKLGDLQRLLEPIAANATDLAHLEVSRAKLANLLSQAVTINKQQAAHRAAKQEQSVQLKTLIVEGQRLANMLRAALKEHYGIRSEKLVEFGIQPFRGRNRKPTPPSPEGPGSPVTTSPVVAKSQLADSSNS
jgi:hypothetical protein